MTTRRWCKEYGSVYCQDDVKCALCQYIDTLAARAEALAKALERVLDLHQGDFTCIGPDEATYAILALAAGRDKS